eukprot:1161667-Pelagomonas_calceolata.AAC.14
MAPMCLIFMGGSSMFLELSDLGWSASASQLPAKALRQSDSGVNRFQLVYSCGTQEPLPSLQARATAVQALLITASALADQPGSVLTKPGVSAWVDAVDPMSLGYNWLAQLGPKALKMWTCQKRVLLLDFCFAGAWIRIQEMSRKGKHHIRHPIDHIRQEMDFGPCLMHAAYRQAWASFLFSGLFLMHEA